MPYSLRKVPKKTKSRCYQVYNRTTKRIFSKCTTLSRAKRQMRLLNAIDHGFRPKVGLSKTGRSLGMIPERSVGIVPTGRQTRRSGGSKSPKRKSGTLSNGRSLAGPVGRMKSMGETFSNMSNEELKTHIAQKDRKEMMKHMPFMDVEIHSPR